jgi:hypothetical protein
MPAAIIPILASVAGSVVSGLMTSKPKAPKAEKPTPMPAQNAGDLARRKSITEQQSRQGRASTILTDTGTDTLG